MKRIFLSLCSIYACSLMAQVSTVRLKVESPNGRVTGRAIYNADDELIERPGVPDNVAMLRPIVIAVSSLVDGYVCDAVTVSCTSVKEEYSVMQIIPVDGEVTIPGDFVQGDICISAPFVATSDAVLKPVLSEEFNGDEHSLPDRSVWSTCDNWGSTWDRFVSSSRDVAYVSDGHLVCRAFANPGRVNDKGAMISGAKESRLRFYFTHGYIEGRIKTNPHRGNFPAFWLMPENQNDGWPKCGEIDIWETINTENRVYQTVHSYWIDRLHNWGTPSANGRNEACWQYDEWHTYGLLKEDGIMKWYVDGEEVFSYARSTNESQLAQGQWPFEKAFYIILNQSVGDGSWAANYDVNYTYETLFDWVRVYQTPVEGKRDGNEVLQDVATGILPLQNFAPPFCESSSQPIATDTSACLYTLDGLPVTASSVSNIRVSKGRKKLFK